MLCLTISSLSVSCLIRASTFSLSLSLPPSLSLSHVSGLMAASGLRQRLHFGRLRGPRGVEMDIFGSLGLPGVPHGILGKGPGLEEAGEEDPLELAVVQEGDVVRHHELEEHGDAEPRAVEDHQEGL